MYVCIYVVNVFIYVHASLLNYGVCISQDTLPYNDYFDYYGPEYRLHLPVSNMENQNSAGYLEEIKITVLQMLDNVEASPGTVCICVCMYVYICMYVCVCGIRYSDLYGSGWHYPDPCCNGWFGHKTSIE